MNKIQKTSVKATNVLLCIFCCCILSLLSVSGVAGQMNNNPFILDINSVKDNADLVLVGSLELIYPPFEILGKDFYKIHSNEILKGKLFVNSLIVITRNVSSYEGIAPTVEPDSKYMLFLKRTELKENVSKLVLYQLTGNWKGIISADSKASEKRAVQNILKHYGINIHKDMPNFIKAIRYSLNKESEKKSADTDFSYIFNGLKLKKD